MLVAFHATLHFIHVNELEFGTAGEGPNHKATHASEAIDADASGHDQGVSGGVSEPGL